MSATSDIDETVKLPAVLDLAAAEGLLTTFHHRLAAGQPLRLDASKVETLTLPCIQIILAAIRTYDQVTIEIPSVGFASAFADLGLTWEQGRDQDHAVNEDQTDESSMPKKILTIDDSKTMRDMLMLTLAHAGFDVLQAVDGQDGIDVLGDQRVDVVITDINMPKMDGYEVIRCLRKSPVHKSTPILVLTTESDTEKKNLAREAGATGWMVKPFDPERLIATIRKVSP
jgi:two-component system, chemotaxis family, chemotaxis protein CheY